MSEGMELIYHVTGLAMGFGLVLGIVASCWIAYLMNLTNKSRKRFKKMLCNKCSDLYDMKYVEG